MLLDYRRNFLKKSFIATTSVTLFPQNILASNTPLETLKVVQTDLFPHDMIEDANAFGYLSVILNHSRVSKADKQFLRNGIRWLNEESMHLYKRAYIKLDTSKRQAVLKEITQESWGKSWIKMLLGYIMEAILGDPIYGINKKESGWKWLEHESGQPRPKKALY